MLLLGVTAMSLLTTPVVIMASIRFLAMAKEGHHQIYITGVQSCTALQQLSVRAVLQVMVHGGACRMWLGLCASEGIQADCQRCLWCAISDMNKEHNYVASRAERLTVVMLRLSVLSAGPRLRLSCDRE